MFCDTSVFFAAIVPSDPRHRRAVELLEGCVEAGTQLATTWDVISETVTLLTYRYDTRAGVDFLDQMKPGLIIVPTTAEVLKQAETLFRREAPRHRLSFCDAISCVMVAAVLHGVPILTFDHDFARLGLRVIA